MSRYRRGRSTFKRVVCWPRQEERGLIFVQNDALLPQALCATRCTCRLGRAATPSTTCAPPASSARPPCARVHQTRHSRRGRRSSGPFAPPPPEEPSTLPPCRLRVFPLPQKESAKNQDSGVPLQSVNISLMQWPRGQSDRIRQWEPLEISTQSQTFQLSCF